MGSHVASERRRSPPSHTAVSERSLPLGKDAAGVSQFLARLGAVPAALPGSPGGPPDADARRWFQSVKANLEHFGDVEVFIDGSTRECACCCEQMNTAYRIRPRKCRHVYHIECLLQWWTEGTCPVCSVSFAPESKQQGALQTQQQQTQQIRHAGLNAMGGSGSAASSDHAGRPRSQSPSSALRGSPSESGSVVGVRAKRSGSGGPALLSRPAGLPGPGTFGAGDLAPNS